MMMKDKALPVSIFCLAVAMIVSAIIIANGMRDNGNYVNSGLSGNGASISAGLSDISRQTNSEQNQNNVYNDSVVNGRNTYNLSAASAYLGITQDQLVALVNAKDSGIPYIEVDSNYIFGKAALDKWMETARIEVK